MNLYAYVGGDPVNFTDPLGLNPDIVVNGYPAGNFLGSSLFGNVSAGGLTTAQLEKLIEEATRQTPLEEDSADNTVVITGVRQKPLNLAHFQRGGGSFGGAGAHSSYPSPCGCLGAGTLVATSNGLRPIEDIRVGDFVMSVSESTRQISAKPVTALIRPRPKPLYALSALNLGGDTETFYATDDHPWKVEGKGWVETADLKLGDRIDTGSGADIMVTSLALTSRVVPTYNLTVADWHTFLIGKNQAVVHNIECLDEYGRALTKKFGRPGSAYSQVKGNARVINRQAKAIADGILLDPNRRTINRYNPRLGMMVTDIFSSDGRGLRFGPSGEFITFLEPPRP